MSTYALPDAPRPSLLARALAALFADWDHLAWLVLLLAVASPQGAPTALAFNDPSAYTSVWSLRIGGANVFELGAGALAAAWLARAVVTRSWGRSSAFDTPLLLLAVPLAGLQLVAWVLAGSDVAYLPLDLERLGVPVLAYLLVTRSTPTAASVRTLTLLVAGVLAARYVELVLVHGIFGSTYFGTITGREALIITEDSLLIAFPLLLAWGAVIDRRADADPLKALAVAAAIGAVFLIQLLSLRRGALIFVGGALALRSLVLPRRLIAGAIGAIVLLGAVAVAAGPARSVADDLVYTAKSALLSSDDESSKQRLSEFRNLAANTDGAEWVVGRGLGTLWQVHNTAPVDAASFGSGETAFVRVGWHVYGLDWLYKLGLAGVLLAAAWLVVLELRIRDVLRRGGPDAGRLLSFAILIPIFGLLLFTNLRVGLMCGICLALASRTVDEAPPASAPAPQPAAPAR